MRITPVSFFKFNEVHFKNSQPLKPLEPEKPKPQPKPEPEGKEK